MKKVFGFFSSSVAFILATLSVIIGITTILFTALNLTLLNSTYYKTILSGMYTRLPHLVATETEALKNYHPTVVEEESGKASLSGAPVMFTNLSSKEWEKLVTMVAPAPWLKNQTEQVLDQFFANINNYSNPAKPVTISLVDMKSRLSGDTGIEIIKTLTGSMPLCSAGEEKYWLGRPGQTTLTCRPSEARFTADKKVIKSTLNKVFGSLSDNTTLNGLTLTIDQLLIIHFFKQLPFFGLLAEFLLLGLIAVLKIRNKKSFAIWVGTPLLIVGIFGLVIGLLIVFLVPGLTQAKLITRIPEYWSSEITSTVFGLTGLALRLLGTVISFLSGFTIFLSIVIKRSIYASLN